MDVAFVLWFICGVISAVIASKNGRSILFGLFVGLGLGPLGIVLVLVGGGTETGSRPRPSLTRRGTGGCWRSSTPSAKARNTISLGAFSQ